MLSKTHMESTYKPYSYIYIEKLNKKVHVLYENISIKSLLYYVKKYYNLFTEHMESTLQALFLNYMCVCMCVTERKMHILSQNTKI